jgi:hypothetical protein
MFMHKYGLSKVGERKFLSLFATCIQYRQTSPRVRIFGRFLGLYEPLKQNSLRLYVDVVDLAFKLVLNFQIIDADECPLVPTARAIEIFKQILGTRLST